jgi:muramidase (phage lysozyme)
MPRTAANDIGGPHVAAFLDMLAFSEGTDNGRQRTLHDGYDVLVGGGLFTDFAKHPRVLVDLPKLGIKSTAAGRYQFLAGTWAEVAALLKLPDFGPESQDRACVQLIKRRKALPLVMAGEFRAAVEACRKEWASLPGAGYGQHEQRIEMLEQVYHRALQEYA